MYLWAWLILFYSYFPCTAAGIHQQYSLARYTSAIDRNDSVYTCNSDVNALRAASAAFDARYFTYHGMTHNLVVRNARPGLDANTTADEWDLSCAVCRKPPNFVTYVHIVTRAVVDHKGAVFTSRFKIVPLMWHEHRPLSTTSRASADAATTPLNSYRVRRNDKLFTSAELLWSVRDKIDDVTASNVLLVNEVFCISVRFAAENFGHSLLESWTRLSLFVPFLQQNPTVAIHVGNVDFLRDYLIIFGLRNPLIDGTVIAKRVFLPESNAPYLPSVHFLQATADHVHSYVTDLLRNDAKLSSSMTKRNLIIYVHRTFSRQLKQDHQIEQYLRTLARDTQQEYYQFRDDQFYDVNETLLLFRRAVLVFGAHGAGLSNVIFSQRNTSLVEIQCQPPWTASTFRHVTYKLGMRFRSLMGHPTDGVNAGQSGRPNSDHCAHGLKVHNMDELKRSLRAMLDLTLSDLRTRPPGA